MARQFSSGWETRSLLAEFDSVTGTSPTIVTTGQRSGDAAMDCNPVGATSYVTKNTAAMVAGSVWYFRVYVKVLSNPAANTRVIDMWGGTGNGSFGIVLKTDGSVQAQAQTGDTLAPVGSATSPLAAGWHRLEVSGAWSTDTVTAKLDGTQFYNAVVAGAAACTTIKLGIVDSTTAHVLFDDFAFNDQSGTTQNSFPGDGSIVHLLPDATGDINAGTSLGGSTPAATVWQSIDEVPPDDGVTFVSTTATGTTNGFLVNLQSATTKLTSVSSVTLTQVGNRVSGATTSSCNYASRHKSGSTTTNGTSVTLASTSWFFYDDTSPRMYDPLLTFYVDPADSAAWTLAKLDGVQIGMYSPSDASPNPRSTAMWLLVEYVPRSGYTLSAASGSYVVSGTAAGVRKGSVLGAVAASYQLTGTNATLFKGRTLAAASGSYLLTGTTTGLQKTNKLTAASGVYALTGTATGLKRASRLSAASASYALTGTTTGLATGFKLPVTLGSFLVSGTATGLARASKLNTSAGSYSVTGTTTGLRRGYQIAPTVGAYTWIGSLVDLTYQHSGMAYTLTASSGAYLCQGFNTVLRKGSQLVPANGAYNVTGTSTGLRRGLMLTPDSGTYEWTGNLIDLIYQQGRQAYTLTASSGAYLCQGTQVSLFRGRTLFALTGGYTFSGGTGRGSLGRTLSTTAGSYVWSGKAATSVHGFSLAAGNGSYQQTGTSLGFRWIHVLKPNTGIYSLTGTTTTLRKGSVVGANAGSYQVTGIAAAVRRGYAIVAQNAINFFHDPNVAINSDFESTVGPSYWETNTSAVITNNPANAHTGNRYMLITSGVSSFQSRIKDSLGNIVYFPIAAGDSVSITGWVYRESGSAGCQYLVRWYLADKTPNGASGTPGVGTGVWTQSTGTLVAPANTAYCVISCYVSGASTVARFDDVTVTIPPNGVYALKGTAVRLGKTNRLLAQPGQYVVTGIAGKLKFFRSLVAVAYPDTGVGRITFTLTGQSSTVPRALNALIVVPTVTATPDGSGFVNISLVPNDAITPPGTVYQVTRFGTDGGYLDVADLNVEGTTTV